MPQQYPALSRESQVGDRVIDPRSGQVVEILERTRTGFRWRPVDEDLAVPAPTAPPDVLTSLRGAETITGPRPLSLKMLDLLPPVGGLVGGVAGLTAGGWPAIGGAGLGGAAGEAFRQLGRRALGYSAPGTPGEAAAGIATEGALQAAAETAGGVLSAIPKGLGLSLLRGSAKIRPQDVEQFGDLAPILARERIPVGPGVAKHAPTRQGILRRGSATAKGKLQQAAEAVTELLGNAKEITISGQPAIDAIDAVMLRTARGAEGFVERDLTKMSRLRKSILNEFSGGLTPERAHQLKTDFAERARRIYERRAGGERITSRDVAEQRLAEAAADGLRRELAGNVNGYAPLERRLQGLIGAQRVVSRGEAEYLASPPRAGHRLERNPLFHTGLHWLENPAFWSRLGLGLTHPAIQPLLRQAPRGALALGSLDDSER